MVSETFSSHSDDGASSAIGHNGLDLLYSVQIQGNEGILERELGSSWIIFEGNGWNWTELDAYGCFYSQDNQK